VRVVHISTFDHQGGAAIAAHRLHRALRGNGVDSSMLVLHKSGNEDHIASVLASGMDRLSFKIGTGLDERTVRLIKKIGAGSFSLARFGHDIARHPWVREADIVNLHWLQGGYISLKGLSRLFALGKPVIWTMHDMWPFTGGCHYSGGCAGYTGDCADCPMLLTKYRNTTKRMLRKKSAAYQNARLYPVGCSTWLRDIASQSAVFQSIDVRAIPNPIDTDTYRPLDKRQARQRLGLDPDGTYVLFGAASPAVRRKGYAYLVQALRRLRGQCTLLVYGADEMQGAGGLTVQSLGKLDESGLLTAYAAADVFVVPSLEDNLPNTVMEAMACGLPVAAFDAGGISDMIEHGKTGYLAQIRVSEDLAQGIVYCLTHHDELAASARKKVEILYTNAAVARQYIDLYEKALSQDGR
jgi:glycosyltransferase involved in cell wall biosynthesis